MTLLYPIGDMSASSNNGTIDSISYGFFEPNGGCQSSPSYHNIHTKFQNQTILATKKAESTLNISYEYENIFDGEFKQIQHFLDNVDESLTPFFVVDLSKGVIPTAIDGSWVVSLSNTRLFSSIPNKKGYYVFLYNGASWKFGTVSTITANTSITISISSNFGNLLVAEAGIVTGPKATHVYPIYECYAMPNALDGMKKGEYINNDDADRGFLRSGSIGFVSKYKV